MSLISRMKGWARRYWRRALLLLGVLATGFYFLPVVVPKAPFSLVLLAGDEQVLGATLAADQQWRYPLAVEPPEKFVKALLAFEDRRFYLHPGVDPIALVRASISNLKAAKVVSGASTLSMQVVRLARANPERRFSEKLLELILALRLEAAHSKGEILHFYAQYAPFGGNIVGVESAAQRYFGRSANHLSWAEAATLAVLPNSPALVHVSRKRDTLKTKRDRLLQRLHDSGVLTEMELKLAKLEPLPHGVLALPNLAPHLLTSVRQNHSPVTIKTSLDARLQSETAEILEREGKKLALEGVWNAAVLVIENQDLKVKAYHGNMPHEQLERGEDVDLIMRPRSSGSILKPLLYALMLQTGEITPAMLVADVPTQINGYRPQNFDRSFRGAVRADEALALSLNIPAVRLLREHGVTRFQQQLEQMGFSSLFRPPEDYGLTLILGGAETSLWDVAQSYAQLANISQQKNSQSTYLRASYLTEAEQTKASAARKSAEYGPGAAYLALQAMAEVNRPGLDKHWQQFSSTKRVAWKTGTSFGLRDAWAVAVTPAYTVAVWAGNAHGQGVAGLSGTNTAAPLLFAVLNRLPDSGWFQEPADDLRSIQVCADSGYLPFADCQTAEIQLPKSAHFGKISAWHKQVHLDGSGRFRVHADCSLMSERQAKTYLQLPPSMAFYYRQQHPNYRDIPSWRYDCAAQNDELVMELLYPEPGAQLYLPTDLNNREMPMIAEAAHRDADTVLYWHLDDAFLVKTKEFHTISFKVKPGKHELSIVDKDGARLTRRFEVLHKNHQ